jgi:hypothetical protein
MPKHGDERNRQIVSDWTPAEGILPDGSTVELGHGHTRTVSERYCAGCGAWLRFEGVVGHLEWLALHRDDHAPKDD